MASATANFNSVVGGLKSVRDSPKVLATVASAMQGAPISEAIKVAQSSSKCSLGRVTIPLGQPDLYI
jgi:hypothetical protein